MGSLAASSVVTVRFPFSDLSQTKFRPAVVLADDGRSDWVLCQITSNAYADPRAVKLEAVDFARGSLQVTSYARPGKLFTASSSLIGSDVGDLSASALKRLREAVIDLVQKGC